MNVDSAGCNIAGDAANEPSIAVDPGEPRKIVIGWRQFNSVESSFREAGYAYSHDGGHTWVFPGSLDPGVFRSDPVLAAGPSGTIYYFGLSLGPDAGPGTLFRSFDGGMTWDREAEFQNSDKPWMCIDQTGYKAGDRIYAFAFSFWRSLDGGNTIDHFWDGSQPSIFTCHVGPDGRMLVVNEFAVFSAILNPALPHLSPTRTPSVRVDLGGRATPGLPNAGGLVGQIWVDADHTNWPSRGNIYLLGSVDYSAGAGVDVAFSRSTDGGATWIPKKRVNDDQYGNGAWHWFGTMSVAPNGRIDVVWNDTRNSGEANVCELYYSYSNDAGETWSPNVPLSPMFDSWVGYPGGNNKLGDYYHMVSDNLGVNVAYAATFNGEQDIYFLRIGPWDCNGNEVDDAADISSAASNDCNANDVPDECEYRVDIDGGGLTTIEDYTLLSNALTGPSAPLSGPFVPFLDKEGAGGGDPPQSPLSKGGGCDELFDANHDGHIDLIDYAYLQRVFVAP